MLVIFTKVLWTRYLRDPVVWISCLSFIFSTFFYFWKFQIVYFLLTRNPVPWRHARPIAVILLLRWALQLLLVYMISRLYERKEYKIMGKKRKLKRGYLQLWLFSSFSWADNSQSLIGGMHLVHLVGCDAGDLASLLEGSPLNPGKVSLIQDRLSACRVPSH